MTDIIRLARTIACHQDAQTPDGTRVCADQWEIASNLGIEWWAMTAAVKAARVELGIQSRLHAQ